MKVFIILTNITNRAGTERAVVNLCNILAEFHNFSVSIVSADSDSGRAAYELNENVKIFHLAGTIGNPNPVKKLLGYKKLFGFLKKAECEYGKDNCFIGTDVSFNILIGFFKKAKTVGCEHMNYGSASFVHKYLRKICYPKLNKVVLLTEKDRERYQFLHNAVVIPNCISFAPERVKNYANKKVIAIGRYTQQKGFDLLLDAINLLKERINEWTFELIGDGEQKSLLEEKVKFYGLGKIVKLLPPTSDIQSIYHSASIYVMSSRWEGLPMVLIEAQSCGLPIVSFDCPEGPSLLVHDGKDGYLVPPNDIQALSEKLLDLMNDESKRSRFGHEAFENAKSFSVEAISEKWKVLFGELACKESVNG